MTNIHQVRFNNSFYVSNCFTLSYKLRNILITDQLVVDSLLCYYIVDLANW